MGSGDRQMTDKDVLTEKLPTLEEIFENTKCSVCSEYCTHYEFYEELRQAAKKWLSFKEDMARKATESWITDELVYASTFSREDLFEAELGVARKDANDKYTLEWFIHHFFNLGDEE
jgi:hypothetical protein